MYLITNYEELDVIIVKPIVPARTARRRRRRIHELAWQEFAYGGPQTTPRSALRRALNQYLPDVGLWIRSCTLCSSPFAAKRDDARFCTDACRKRAARRSSTS